MVTLGMAMTFFWYNTKGTSQKRHNKQDFIKNTYALWNALLIKFEENLQTGRKYFQNVYLLKDCYPKYLKNS